MMSSLSKISNTKTIDQDNIELFKNFSSNKYTRDSIGDKCYSSANTNFHSKESSNSPLILDPSEYPNVRDLGNNCYSRRFNKDHERNPTVYSRTPDILSSRGREMKL